MSGDSTANLHTLKAELSHGASNSHTSVGRHLVEHTSIYLFVSAIVLVVSTICNITALDDGASGERAAQAMSLPLYARLLAAAAATALGVWALLCSQRARQAFGTIPGILFAALGAVFVATSFFAFKEVAVVSQSAALIFLGYLLFAASIATSFKLETVLRLLLLASCVFLLVSWFLFLVIPSKGVFLEHTVIGTQVPRMGGTAHPNVVGREGAIAVLIAAGLLRMIGPWKQHPIQTLFLFGMVALGLATLVATKSRTSTLAMIFALGLLLGDRFFTRRGILIAGLGAASIFGGILIAEMIYDGQFLSEKILDKVTKTGRADELTSATGRTEIWGHALELLWERPLTGWGLDSAASLDIAAASTHNLLLNIAFSAGLIAAAIGMMLILWTAVYGMSSSTPVIRGLCGYVLISGIVEDTVLESFPGTLTILWITILIQQAWLATQAKTLNSSPPEPSTTQPPAEQSAAPA